MRTHPLPFLVAAVGVFLVAGAVLAVAAGATVAALSFASAGALHLAAAGGAAVRSRRAIVAGGFLGLADLALIALGVWFILGIQIGLGAVDLGVAWFAPLNGYGTVAVAGAIAVVAGAMVAAGVREARAGGASSPAGV
jgi:hypothetical protein